VIVSHGIECTVGGINPELLLFFVAESLIRVRGGFIERPPSSTTQRITPQGDLIAI
jgi:hypothetical protein